MFRAAPPSERKPLSSERASTLGSASVDRYSTKGPRRYPFRLNLYDKPPIHEVTIEQFEIWAIDRLRGETIKSDTIVKLKTLLMLCL